VMDWMISIVQAHPMTGQRRSSYGV